MDNKNLNLYKFKWELRDGEVSSLFLATKEEINSILGKNVYFGEINGSNSCVSAIIEKEDFKLLTDDQNYIQQTIKLLKLDKASGYTIIGYNPFCYLDED